MKKVVLGLSGGVDSAVAAYLLKEKYDVECVFMRNWDSALNNDINGNPTINDDVCPQEIDYQDAKEAARILNIPIYRKDFIEEYWNTVFKYFLDEYNNNRTPNPDIMCNKYIKFKAFLDYAKSYNCDYIAMGHYARREDRNGISFLLRGKDALKDQSYFLSFISQDALSKTLFPIGDLTKKEVREIANKIYLNVAHKKDSTGICFIGERNFRQFLKNYIPSKPGDIVTTNGEVIGKHDGLMYYTLGQRKGLGIGGLKSHIASPWFVVRKDLESGNLVVAQENEENLLVSNHLYASNLNLISIPLKNDYTYSVKFRYRGEDFDATIKMIDDSKIEVIYKNGYAVTPGQAVVIYDGEACLGGAIIDSVYYNEKRMA